MNNITDNNKCYGCGACANICPANAIKFQREIDGFYVAKVIESNCVNCGRCVSVCPVNNPGTVRDPIAIYAAKCTDDTVRQRSSSGGVFPVLAAHVLSSAGVVYGVAYDEDGLARHIRVCQTSELHRLSGSKYMQSDVGSTFKNVNDDLKSGKRVLFSGTGCQLAGLYHYLNYNNLSTDNLITIDIVCHGAQSPEIYYDFKKMLEIKENKRISFIEHRTKKVGWRGHNINVVYADGSEKTNTYRARAINKLFTLSAGRQCFECAFAQPARATDITLGDFWGIEKTNFANMEDVLGVSMVLIRTPKGLSLFDEVKNQLELIRCSLDDCSANTPLFRPTTKPNGYDAFWNYCKVGGYPAAVKKYCYPAGLQGIKGRLRHFMIYDLHLSQYLLRVKNKM